MTEARLGVATKIWDVWVRSFHWMLAISVGFLLVSGNTGFQFFEWHRQAGEFVLALLLFRLLWSLFGSSNARLHKLVVNPKHALTHLLHLARGNVAQERGHNAAGGWAIIVMLLLIAFQAISGLFIADEDEFIEGAFYGTLGSDLSETLLHLHHSNAQLLLILLGLHVLMVFFYLVRAGQNLVTPMITGSMIWRSKAVAPLVKFSHPVLGLLLLCVSVAGLGLLLGWFTV